MSTDEGKHWTTPVRQAEIFGEPLFSAAFQLVSAFQKLGISNPEALSIIASICRPIRIIDESHFGEMQTLTDKTLRTLDDKALLHGDGDAIATVIDRWQFPLYPLDLRPVKVARRALREAQRAEADSFYEQF